MRFQSRLPVMNSAGPSASLAFGERVSLVPPLPDRRVRAVVCASVVLVGVLHRPVVRVVEPDESVDGVGDVRPQLGPGEPIVVRRRVCHRGDASARRHALHHDVAPAHAGGPGCSAHVLNRGFDVLLGPWEHRSRTARREEVVIRQEDDVALGNQTVRPRAHTFEPTADAAAAVHDQHRDVALIRSWSAQLPALFSRALVGV